jgi:hypothetical protein
LRIEPIHIGQDGSQVFQRNLALDSEAYFTSWRSGNMEGMEIFGAAFGAHGAPEWIFSIIPS